MTKGILWVSVTHAVALNSNCLAKLGSLPGATEEGKKDKN